MPDTGTSFKYFSHCELSASVSLRRGMAQTADLFGWIHSHANAAEIHPSMAEPGFRMPAFDRKAIIQQSSSMVGPFICLHPGVEAEDSVLMCLIFHSREVSMCEKHAERPGEVTCFGNFERGLGPNCNAGRNRGKKIGIFGV